VVTLESKDYEVELIHRDIIAIKVRIVSGRELFFADYGCEVTPGKHMQLRKYGHGHTPSLNRMRRPVRLYLSLEGSSPTVRLLIDLSITDDSESTILHDIVQHPLSDKILSDLISNANEESLEWLCRCSKLCDSRGRAPFDLAVDMGSGGQAAVLPLYII
jgi:hypothetical protein